MPFVFLIASLFLSTLVFAADSDVTPAPSSPLSTAPTAPITNEEKELPTNTTTSADQNRWFSLYLGLGNYSTDISSISPANAYTWDGYSTLGISAGVYTPINEKWDAHVGVNYHSKDTTIGKSTCITTTNLQVSCTLKGKNNILFIPVGARYRHTFSHSISASIGSGLSIYKFSRTADYEASGYNGLPVYDDKKFGISPYLSVSLQYNKWLASMSRYTLVGDDSIGKGNVTAISIEYVFDFNQRVYKPRARAENINTNNPKVY